MNLNDTSVIIARLPLTLLYFQHKRFTCCSCLAPVFNALDNALDKYSIHNWGLREFWWLKDGSPRIMFPFRRTFTIQPNPSKRYIDIVYGSFMKAPQAHGLEAEALKSLNKSRLRCNPPRSGNEFMTSEDLLVSLQDTSKLIVVTSSRNGLPPPNMLKFVEGLIKAADEKFERKPLTGLHHAVFGNGNAKWFKTYMSIPRLIDAKLTELGSKRIIPRGEYFESYKNLNLDHLKLSDWGTYVWDELDKMEGERERERGEENTGYLELTLEVLKQYEDGIVRMNKLK